MCFEVEIRNTCTDARLDLCCTCSICGQHAVSFFLNSSAQHRENEAESDSNENERAWKLRALRYAFYVKRPENPI